MWPQTTLEQRIAIQQQMVRSQCRADSSVRFLNELHGCSCGRMLKNHSQLGEALKEWAQHGVDEMSFPIEDVDLRIGGFSVHQQRQTATRSVRKAVASLLYTVEYNGGQYIALVTAIQMLAARVRRMGHD